MSTTINTYVSSDISKLKKGKTSKQMPSETTKPKKKNTKKTLNLSMPKAKLAQVIKLLNDDKDNECDDYFRTRCSVPVHFITTKRHNPKSNLFILLEEARLCVLQKDWKTLAKILSLAKPSRQDHSTYFQMFVRYALIYLAHNRDDKLMDMFLLGVVGCSGEMEKEDFLKSLTTNN